MESKVKLSTYSLILTLIVTGVMLTGVALLLWNGENKGFIMAILLFLLLISGWLYSPVSISANENDVTVRSFLRRQRIHVSDIQSVELFQPTMGAIRLFASGGFMGYWGLFREGDIGRYVAYYGKASDCFLIRMKNGDKYVLGCENPGEMVDYIDSKLK